MCIYCRFKEKRLSLGEFMEKANNAANEVPEAFKQLDEYQKNLEKDWFKSAKITVFLTAVVILGHLFSVFSSMNLQMLFWVTLMLLPVCTFLLGRDIRKIQILRLSYAFEKGKVSAISATQHFEKLLLEDDKYESCIEQRPTGSSERERFHA